MDNFFKLLKQGSESNAPKYSLYQADFDKNSSKVYLENGTPIHLDERCDGERYSDNKKDNVPPYRYWFWIRANKKASTSITWRLL